MLQFAVEDDDSIPPLACLVALDLLSSLIARNITDITMSQEGSEGGEKSKDDTSSSGGKGKEGEEEQEEKGGGGGEVPSSSAAPKASEKRQAFYHKFGETLIPVLIGVAAKLLRCAHTYTVFDVCSAPPQSQATPEEQSFSSSSRPLQDAIPRDVLDRLLSVASSASLAYRGSSGGEQQQQPIGSLFLTHLPDEAQERLKLWNSSLLINQSQKARLWKSSVEEFDFDFEGCLRAFLDNHFKAFSIIRTFDPARNMKSCLQTVFHLLRQLLELDPGLGEGEGEEGEREGEEGGRGRRQAKRLVPLVSDAMLEFMHADLLELISVCDRDGFCLELSSYRLRESFGLVSMPSLEGLPIQSMLVGDLFDLLDYMMLECATEWPVLAQIDGNEPPTGWCMADNMYACMYIM